MCTLVTSLMRCDAFKVYQTPSLASRHVLKDFLKWLKNVKNLEFSLISVTFIVTFGPENRVCGTDEHRFLRHLDEFDHLAWSKFSHLVCARRGAWRSEIHRNPPKCSEILRKFHVIFTSSGHQFSDVLPSGFVTTNQHNRVQNNKTFDAISLFLPSDTNKSKNDQNDYHKHDNVQYCEI